MTSYIIRKISFILFSQRLQISYRAFLSDSVMEKECAKKMEYKSKIALAVEQKCDIKCKEETCQLLSQIH